MRIIVCLMLVFTIIGSSVAYAAIESNAYISSYSGAVSINSSGTVTVNFGVWGTDKMDKLGASGISIYENGVFKKTYSWSNPLYSASMRGEDVYHFYGSVTYDGTAGNHYQAYITFRGEKDGSGASEYLWTNTT